MSHLAAVRTVPGKPEITDLNALRAACQALGLEFAEGTHYRTWKDDHGAWVGDWEPPVGADPATMGDDAEYVIRVPADQHGPRTKPYELGVVPDPANPGCWRLVGDFYAGGYGLHKFVGRPIFKKGTKEIECLAPTLLQHYRMELVKEEARLLGENVEFEKQQDGSYVAYAVANVARLQSGDSFGV